MNDAWGTKKKNFYGRDKKHDVSKLIFTNSSYRMSHQVKMIRMSIRRL
jgi:hypothetical protein